jgi:hypothetical protein
VARIRDRIARIRDRFDKNFREKGFVRHADACIGSKAYKELWLRVGEWLKSRSLL